MRQCTLRLSEQPLLAGMKHLNRLEQVLARAEWNDPDIDEGLLLDGDGRVVSAIMANMFAVIDGVLCDAFAATLRYCRRGAGRGTGTLPRQPNR